VSDVESSEVVWKEGEKPRPYLLELGYSIYTKALPSVGKGRKKLYQPQPGLLLDGDGYGEGK
jgi:hypothetical protein